MPAVLKTRIPSTRDRTQAGALRRVGGAQRRIHAKSHFSGCTRFLIDLPEDHDQEGEKIRLQEAMYSPCAQVDTCLIREGTNSKTQVSTTVVPRHPIRATPPFPSPLVGILGHRDNVRNDRENTSE